jgi:hypothetical protein
MDQQADLADLAPKTTTTGQDTPGSGRAARRWAGRTGRSTRLALPAAIGGTFLIAALALGAAGALPVGPRAAAAAAPANPGQTTGAGGSAGQPQAAAGALGEIGGSEPSATAGDHGGVGQPSAEATSTPGTESSGEPTAEPSSAPSTGPSADPTPAPEMHLVGSLKDGHPFLDWTACTPDGFHVYRIVRSSDNNVTWPMGGGDVIANGTEHTAVTALPDPHAPAGHTFWYRAFALITGADGGLALGCASNTVEVEVPTPTPDPTSEPTSAPTSEPTPAPTDNQRLELHLSWADGKVVVDWSPCTADGFNTYEVVRSLDGTVRWPMLTEGDKVVAAMGPGDTLFRDGDAPRGVTVYYRVFCVKIDGDHIAVLTSSAARGITTPEPAAPSPTTIDLAVNVTDGGNVELNWSMCPADGFISEKVVRSATDNPSAVPMTEGSQVRATYTSRSTVHFLDTDVAGGQHWFYRVQCLGNWYGSTVLSARSAVADAVLP